MSMWMARTMALIQTSAAIARRLPKLQTFFHGTACSGLALALLAITPAAFAADDVDPPEDLSACAGTSPPRERGSAVVTPGRWWNPKRFGTGWDFNYSFDQTKLLAHWYTYDRNRQPIWLLSLSNDVLPATNVWRAPLNKYTWNYNTQANSGSRVGSVALRFDPNNPARAALRWQWDEVSQASYTECVFDFQRPQPNATGPTGTSTNSANATFTGSWHEPQPLGLDGWGAFFSIATQTATSPTSYAEFHGVSVYATNGQPRWLHTRAQLSAAPPAIGLSLPFMLDYFKAGPAYASGVPITDCEVPARPQSDCVATVDSTGTFRRSYIDGASADVSIEVNAPATRTGDSSDVTWRRPATGSGTVAFAKITDAIGIVADRLQCTVLPGQSTCPITLNWGSLDPTLTPYRRDLNTGGTPTQLSTVQVGEYTDQLTAGARVMYALQRTAAGYVGAISTPEIRAVSGNIGDQTLDDLAADKRVHDPTVGAVPGEGGVEAGVARYSIAIAIPPGRSGMQPELALEYSSRGGSGIAGMGFSLSGLSSVHRCPRTPTQDGQVRAVRLDGSDALCLDGERLVSVTLTGGSCTNPISGAVATIQREFRTEIDRFGRVLQCAGVAGPSTATWFLVESDNGTIEVYGTSAASQSTPSGATSPISWFRDRRTDRIGNYIEWTYTSPTAGEILPSVIRYTGLAGSGNLQTSPRRREIVFGYSARPNTLPARDISSTGLAGSVARQTQRLSTITTSVGGATVRRYTLTYDASSANSGRSLLRRIGACAFEGTTARCVPETTFEWRDAALGFAAAPLSLSGLPAYIPPVPVDTEPNPEVSSTPPSLSPFFDVDGDGARETLIALKSGSTRSYYLASLSPERQVVAAIAVPTSLLPVLQLQPGFADFDGDGRADLLGRSTTSATSLVSWHWINSKDAPTFNSGRFVEQATGIMVDASELNDRLVHAGDVDGDGLADIVIDHWASNSPGPAARELRVYRNTTPLGATALTFNPTFTSVPLQRVNSNIASQHALERVADFDGDGLVEFFIRGERNDAGTADRDLDSVWFGSRTSGGVYSVSVRNWLALFQTGEAASQTEQSPDLTAYWLDLNGDGLDDLLYAGCPPTGGCSGVSWILRYNNGSTLGPAIAATGTARTAGLEFCAPNTNGSGGCVYGQNGVFRPQFAHLYRIVDTDADGRAELALPDTAAPFAALVCRIHPIIPEGMQGCPPPSAPQPQSPLGNIQTNSRGYVCHQPFYICPENPRTAKLLDQLPTVPARVNFLEDRVGNDGVPETWTPLSDPGNSGVPTVAASRTGSSPTWDSSLYRLNVLRFIEGAAVGTVEVREESGRGLIANSGGGLSEDVYGDGLTDHLLWHGCRQGVRPDHLTIGLPCAVPRRGLGADYPESISPTAIRNGQDPTVYPDQPLLKVQYLVSENLGVGIRSSVSVKRAPHLPDLIAQAIDAFGNSTAWTYDPLGSSYARYRILDAARRVDGQHVNFSSSMPVVTTSVHTTGSGASGLRSIQYGYRDALFDRLGRGFRGFRQIIAEDLLDGRRVTTTFHQRFPLTGRVARIEVSANSRSLSTVADPTGEIGGNIDSTSAPISVEHQRWRCNRNSRSTPCADTVGTTSVRFPYLDRRETWSYDITSASGTGLAVTTPIGHVQWNAAASAASATSGYDAYGNLFAEVTQTDDGGTASNSAGYTPVVAAHTRSISRCFARDDSSACSTVSVPGPDAGVWWIRRLRREDTTDSITYSSDHPLPVGALAPARTLGRAWTYNATTRLPLTERVYPDLATTPSLTTTTVYDASHGQPTSITLTPRQFTAGSTATTIGYSADGYFAQSRTNAYGHTTTEERRDQDGGVTRSVDADGLITKFALDGWGRVKQIDYRNSGDTANRLPKREIAHTWGCGSACPANSIYQITEVQPGTPSATSSVDSVGRTLRVDTKLEDNSTSRVDTGYDARGFMTRQEMPHRPTETAYATTWSGFDIAGRPGVKTIQRTNPSDALGNLVVRYTYSGRQTAIRVQGSNDFTPLTPPCLPTQLKCLDMTRLVDAFGRVVRTVDASGGRVRYWFDGTGNAVAIEDPLSPNPAITTATYDSLGHRLSTSDPDRGTFHWTYDGLGNVLTQTDPRRMSTLLPGVISTTYSYDALGRRTGRIGSLDFDGAQASAETVTDTWIYDPPVGTAKGQLFQSSRSVYYPAISTSVLEKRTTHEYDSLARRTRSTTDQLHPDNVREILATSVIYDGNYSRPKAEVHPTGDVRWLQYSRYGHLNREQNLSGVIYWVTQSVDARGQPLTALQGPISRTATYDPASGQVSSLIYRNGPTTLRQLHYYYDVYDNVALAQMGGGTTSETYAYDKLLRLTSATRSGGAIGTTTYGYDAAGSFRFKSDQSTVTSTAPHAYQYGSGNQSNVATDAGPHAVTRVTLATAYGGGTRNLSYDDAGNLVSAGNTGSSLGADLFTARYDHDQLPVYLHRNGRTSLLSYGPDGERTRQWATEGTWTYVGAFERSVVGTVSERRVYLGNHTQLSTRAGSTGVDIRYLLTDRLGSVDAVVDAGGTVRETRGYDPFGRPRQGTWADASPATLPSVERTTKGFTQHVHLDGQRLIHMNGRAYDYQLGRFLSVDPVIQFPENSQSLNAYSYILNNPLSGTDPTGFAACDVSSVAKTCLEPGENTITQDGKTVATVHVAEKGQHLSFTTKNGASFTATFTGRSGEVTRAVSGSNLSSVGEISERTNGTLEGSAFSRPLGADASRSTVSSMGLPADSNLAQLQPAGPSITPRDVRNFMASIILMTDLSYVDTTGSGALQPMYTLPLPGGSRAAGAVAGIRAAGGAARGTTTVIGRTPDLKNLALGERSLLDRLQGTLGSPQANWKRSSGVLRDEMRRGQPIRDVSPGDNGGVFLNAERNLLRDRGWTFDSNTNLWMPPVR